jgi:hypothetical protein
LKKFISEPQPPPSGIEIPREGKAKERREVGEGDDTVVVEDTTDDDDDDDEETLQDRFQLRSRFSRPGLPHVPLVQDPRLAWRLAWLRRHGSRTTLPGSGWRRSLRSQRPRLRR